MMTGLVMQLLIEVINSDYKNAAFRPEDLILRRRDGILTYKVMNTILFDDCESAFKRRYKTLHKITDRYLQRICKPLYMREVSDILNGNNVVNFLETEQEICEADTMREAHDLIMKKLIDRYKLLSNQLNMRNLHQCSYDEEAIKLGVDRERFKKCIEEIDIFTKLFYSTPRHVEHAFMLDVQVTCAKGFEFTNYNFKLLNFDMPSEHSSYYNRFENEIITAGAPLYIEQESEERTLRFATENYTNCKGVFAIYRTF